MASRARKQPAKDGVVVSETLGAQWLEATGELPDWYTAPLVRHRDHAVGEAASLRLRHMQAVTIVRRSPDGTTSIEEVSRPLNLPVVIVEVSTRSVRKVFPDGRGGRIYGGANSDSPLAFLVSEVTLDRRPGQLTRHSDGRVTFKAYG